MEEELKGGIKDSVDEEIKIMRREEVQGTPTLAKGTT